MLLLRQLLQLKEQGSSNRHISGKLHVTRNTVNAYIARVAPSGLSYHELLRLDDEALADILRTSKAAPAPVKDDKSTDFEQRLKHFVEQLQNKKTTKTILWEEYREEVPHGYSRSQFCDLLKRYQDSRKAVMHFEHPAAELMEFDFAGDTISYVNPQSGELISCVVLVCRLPCSGYTYLEALHSQQRPQLIAALCRSLAFFGGVPYMVRTDNMAQIVKKANRYEPSFDELAQQWSVHYNTTLTATRVAKPRDKAGVESSVNTAYYRVYAPLRNEHFHSLVELNKAISEKTDKLNHNKYQGRDYSRYEKFISVEQHLLRPLPQDAFVPKTTRPAKVAKDYHVMLGEDRHYYSVPYQNIGKQVNLVYDTENVEIYLNLHRIASHKRDMRSHYHTTLADHMPPNHKHYIEQTGWDEEYFLNAAASIGENTVAAIREVLKQKTFIEQTYRSCMGVMRLASRYGKQRLENACQRALSYNVGVTYGALNKILEKGLDKQPFQPTIHFKPPDHDNLRGAGAFD